MSDNDRHDGRFKPGISGNPSGRPRGAAELRERAAPYVPEAIEQLVHTMRTTKKDTVRIACCREIFDRFAGRPTTPTETDITVLFQRKLSELSTEELMRLRDTIASLEAPLLEHNSDNGPVDTEE